MKTTVQPNRAEELHTVHAQEEDTLSQWADEDLSEADQAVLAELNREAREQRRKDGTESFRAQLLAALAVQAAKEQNLAQVDNDWRNNPDANS
ncbi:MAG: hypothetical protein U0520_01800 [Candidatus Saccharimonadales bacterium]